MLCIQLTHTKLHVHLAVVALSLSLSLLFFAPPFSLVHLWYFWQERKSRRFWKSCTYISLCADFACVFWQICIHVCWFFSARLEISYANHLEGMWVFVPALHPLLRFDWWCCQVCCHHKQMNMDYSMWAWLPVDKIQTFDAHFPVLAVCRRAAVLHQQEDAVQCSRGRPVQ